MGAEDLRGWGVSDLFMFNYASPTNKEFEAPVGKLANEAGEIGVNIRWNIKYKNKVYLQPG